MKKVSPYLFLLLSLTVAGFIAHGSGHVPRQLLLISSSAEDNVAASPLIVAMPAPQPAAIPVPLHHVLTGLPDVPVMPWSDPALPCHGDRSPPYRPSFPS